MAIKHDADKIMARLQADLQSTPYRCSALVALSGGTANYIYRGKLITPRGDGIQDVLVKHGESFVASNPDFKLSTSRCLVEKASLLALSELPAQITAVAVIQTPSLLEFLPETTTQIQEFLPNSIDLKNYVLKRFSSNSNGSYIPCHSFGIALGSWLRKFHEWARAPKQNGLRDTTGSIPDMQKLKHAINYTRLIAQAAKYPALLGDADVVFRELEAAAKAELADTERLQVIHGDFWSGNIILTDQELAEGRPTKAFVVDWEMCHLGVSALDLGQMIAELYELKLFKDISAAMPMITGFVEGYGIDSVAFGTRVALHVGTHLVCFSGVPGWGDEEQVQQVMNTGKELILKAWYQDIENLRRHDLACLFSSAE